MLDHLIILVTLILINLPWIGIFIFFGVIWLLCKDWGTTIIIQPEPKSTLTNEECARIEKLVRLGFSVQQIKNITKVK